MEYRRMEEVLFTGIYTLAVNTGLNLNLDAVNTTLFTKALDNIAMWEMRL